MKWFSGSPDIFIFGFFIARNPFFLCQPLWQRCYQKIWNFNAHILINIKILASGIHRCKRLRKSPKMDFRGNGFEFGIVFNIIWASSFIRWIQKSIKSQNSTYWCTKIWVLDYRFTAVAWRCLLVLSLRLKILISKYSTR